ncbi:MAG: diguanylate cyclase [Kiritimatiellia bacterium]|nr:diguanylate cyclase [Kiritimatiellia bacterium]
MWETEPADRFIMSIHWSKSLKVNPGMAKIENSRVLVLSTDPKRQKAINKMLKKWGCLVESVFTPLDLIQVLLRQEFDVAIIDAALPAYDSLAELGQAGDSGIGGQARLMGYAQAIQPWLQWMMLGQSVHQDSLPAFLPAEPGFRLENPPQPEDLRRQLQEAVQLKQQIMQTPTRLPLNRLLFFLEYLRSFLPELLEHLQSFPLLAYLQAGIASMIPCQVAGFLTTRENYPTLKLKIIHPVTDLFLRQVKDEMLAGYKMLKSDHIIDRAMVVEHEGQVSADSSVNAVGSLFVIPLVAGQQLQGMLAFATAEPRAYSSTETSYICHITNHLSRVFPDLSRMQSLAVRDELTGLNNRRSFENEIRRAWQLSQRYRYPIGLLMMDLDKFKSLNDNYGHMIGDAVLKEFALILESIARRTDVLARYGGDEFAVILTNANTEQTKAFAQRLRDAVANHVFCEDRYPLQMSVSIGAAGSDHPGIDKESDLLSLADRACYLAKESGKGKIGTADEISRGEESVTSPDSMPVAEPTMPAKQGQIMIIDDEPIIGSMFEKMLTPSGFTMLTETNPRRALERIREMPDQIDVALIDLKMPEMNGIDVIKAIKAMAPEIVCIVLTGFVSVDNTIAAIRAGAYDFMQKPVNFDELTFALKRGVEHRQLRRQVETCRQQMEETLDERTRSLNETASALENSYMATMEALAAALTVHETDTVEHDRRVAEYAAFLARRMNVSEEQIIKIKRGALLHDIGKIGIPDVILQKAGALTDAERDVIRQHAAIGYGILRNVQFLQEEAEMLYQHHENYDGSGYPRGLSGKAIIFEARLFAVIDAFDALRSNRVYRKAVSLADTVAEIKRCSGTQFDPEIVEVFLSCYQEMDRLYNKSAGGTEETVTKS